MACEPNKYSVYQKVVLPDGRTQWFGTHRLPITSALTAMREFRDNGYRVAIRREGEPGPSYKD
jgi:hypothetical protein